MCMIDCGESYQVYTSGGRKARKRHICNECSRPIEKSEVYFFIKGLCDGEWGESKHCAHCNIYARWLTLRCGGYLTGHIYEDLEHHYKYDGIKEFFLLRGIIGMRRGWKAFNHDGFIPISSTVSEAG